MKKLIYVLILFILLSFINVKAETNDYDNMSIQELMEERNSLYNKLLPTTKDELFIKLDKDGLLSFINYITRHESEPIAIYNWLEKAKVNINDYINTVLFLNCYGDGGSVTVGVVCLSGKTIYFDSVVENGPFRWNWQEVMRNNYNTYNSIVPTENKRIMDFSAMLDYNPELETVVLTYQLILQDSNTGEISKIILDKNNFSEFINPMIEYINAEVNAIYSIVDEINQPILEKIEYINQLLFNRITKKPLTINLNWLNGNIENKDFIIDIYELGSLEKNNYDDIMFINYLTKMDVNSTFLEQIVPVKVKTVTIPAGQTSMTIELDTYNNLETGYFLIYDSSNLTDYLVTLKDDITPDGQSLGLVRYKDNSTSVTKNIKIINSKLTKDITITNNIEGGDREYSEFLLTLPTLLFNGWSRYGLVSVFNTESMFDDLYLSRYKTLILTDEDEQITMYDFIYYLEKFYAVSMPRYESLVEQLSSAMRLVEKQTSSEYGIMFYIDVDSQQKVIVNKKDINDRLLEGAVLEIYKDNQLIDTWTSSTKELLLENGTYTIKEKESPKGYDKIEDFTLVINGTDKALIDSANKNTNNFFLTDENKEKYQFLKQFFNYATMSEFINNRDIQEVYNYIQENINGITKNDLLVLKIIASNLLYMSNDYDLSKITNSYDIEPQNLLNFNNGDVAVEIKRLYNDFLIKSGMEELIPYLDYSESIFPIIKLRKGETITIKDSNIEKDCAIYLYAKNYSNEGYSIENRSIVLNNIWEENPNYTITYTYTGEIKNRNQILSTNSQDTNINLLTLDIIDPETPLGWLKIKKISTIPGLTK